MSKPITSRFRWLLPAVIFVASCAGSSDRYAVVNYEGPPGKKSHDLFIQARTGNVGCSAHALGPYREISWIRIRLPESPQKNVRYEAAQVTFVEETGSVKPVIKGGFVAFDLQKHVVELSLETATGSYWANGTYALRSSSLPHE